MVEKRKLVSRWQSEHHLIVLGICGMFCLVAGSALGAENAFDGDYTGTRTLTKGDASLCPAKEDVSVDIQGHTLTFSHSTLKDYTVAFDPDSDGSFGEVIMEDGGRQIAIQGRTVGNVLDADVDNPPCEHHWHVKKK
ncbi:MAG TPA: hypothetical protein VEJ16_08310 [Alphaproteobacteria bacterium]|nr:hypothetical protein [Alphaproteobacteria bacterium]